MPALQKNSPCLWFDSEAEDAAHFFVSVFYVSVFSNARISKISHYSKEG